MRFRPRSAAPSVGVSIRSQVKTSCRAANRTPFSVEAPRRDSRRVIRGTNFIQTRDQSVRSRVKAAMT